ncbi:MAG: 4Fe-4S binding protein [PVC group bacterium]|nr:4Fe-4S binding protein [PVC group bacterium]
MSNKKLVLIRRILQTAFLLLFIYILWTTTYPLTGKIPSALFFNADPLIMITTALSERLLLPGLLGTFLLILLTFLGGRFFCGWICPLGTVIDFCGRIKRKKQVLEETENKKVRRVKFYILSGILISALFGIQIAWIVDPTVIMGRFVSLNLIPTTTLILDKFFIFILQTIEGRYEPLFDFYREMKASLLGVKTTYFSHSGIVFVFFLIITSAAFFISRLWCRTLCPLGAFYAVIAKHSRLRRVVDKCVDCGKCHTNCRMGAIKKDNIHYLSDECILCMDCIYECPPKSTRFTFKQGDLQSNTHASGISRRNFLIFLSTATLPLLGMGQKKPSLKDINIRHPRIIRPPAALKEEEFLNRCVRCGNCMKVCPTNGLQPVMVEAGSRSIWTPRLVPEIGYCEYNCTQCSQVCPTGAIKQLPLEQKQKVKLGIAKIDREICLPWKKNKECIVCEEHCPIPDKAIKIKEELINGKIVLRPEIDEDLCTGCAICQTKCPVEPRRAVKISPKKSDRF